MLGLIQCLFLKTEMSSIAIGSTWSPRFARIQGRKRRPSKLLTKKTFNPLHPNISKYKQQFVYSLESSLYISQGTDKENFLNNQELILLAGNHFLYLMTRL